MPVGGGSRSNLGPGRVTIVLPSLNRLLLGPIEGKQGCPHSPGNLGFSGINSILSYAAKILQGAGLTERQAAFNLQIITGINCLVTLLGALLVDKLGRKILLSFGTGGIIICNGVRRLSLLQLRIQAVDVLDQVRTGISADGRRLSVKVDSSLAKLSGDVPSQLSVTYKFEQETKPKIASAFSNAASEGDRTLKVEPDTEKKWVTVDGKKVEETRVKDNGKLEILRASYGPIASPNTGKWVTLLLCGFIAFFAVGPGVCVWLEERGHCGPKHSVHQEKIVQQCHFEAPFHWGREILPLF